MNILYVLSNKLSAEVKNTCEKDDNLVIIFNNTLNLYLEIFNKCINSIMIISYQKFEEYITGHRTGNMWTVLQKHFKIIEVLYKNYYVTYSDTQGKLDDFM